MPLPAVPIALALAKEFGPSLIRHFKGNKAAEVAESVVSIAKDVLGPEKSDEELLEALHKDPQAALTYRLAIINYTLSMTQAQLADVADARARDVEYVRAGVRNIRADVLAYSAILLFAAVVILLLLKGFPEGDSNTVAVMLIGTLTSIVMVVYGFDFGSSVGSKIKDFFKGKENVNN